MRSHFWIYGGAAIMILIALFTLFQVLRGPQIDYVTAKVDRGDIREIVSVSGVIQSDNTAELAFPVTGTVKNINVKEGDNVAAGDIIMSLDTASLAAQRREALGNLQIAEADKQELISGVRQEAREVTAIGVASAEAELERITNEENERVKNARRTLYSSDLQAFPVYKQTDNVPPTITGTYTCLEEGSYELEMFASSADSGYSYKLSGLESGIASAYTSNSGPLGKCGLRIQFPLGEKFGSTDWIIPIPNKNGASYVTNLNAYELAVKQRDNKIAVATEAFRLSQTEQQLENAAPRSEALTRAQADITKASAQLLAIDALIADRILVAPFDGVITDIATKIGETVSINPIVTMVSEEAFEITARIPEIDIAKINNGQKAEVVFDAASSDVLDAKIVFVSPVATEIDGVAYFEAKLQFLDPPSWLKVGLNADVDIIVAETKDVLRAPKRFVIEEADNKYLLLREGNTTVKQQVNTGFTGNDGYIEVFDLAPETIIVAP